MLRTLCRNLRKMGDADHLSFARHISQQPADNLRYRASDAHVDFVEDHAGNRCPTRGGDLNSETDP